VRARGALDDDGDGACVRDRDASSHNRAMAMTEGVMTSSEGGETGAMARRAGETGDRARDG